MASGLRSLFVQPLGLQEVPGGIAYPSHFEVDDALTTAKFMGANVVRSHTLGISVGCSLCVEPALGKFNQVALQHIDYASVDSLEKNRRSMGTLLRKKEPYTCGL